MGAVLTMLVPLVASAETVLRAGDAVSVAADQKVENDFYAAAGTVAMSGTVTGDMYAAGGNVTINGPIGADFTAAGGTVSVHAPVGDDVRIAGGDVTIADHVKGDLFVLAGSVTVLSSATIDGDIFFYGGEADISGAVGGSIMGTAERFRIDAAVKGDVDVSSTRALALGDRAAISGDVRYRSVADLERAQNAVVEGEIVKNDVPDDTNDSGFGSALYAFIITLFAALAAYLLLKRELTVFASEALRNYGRSGVIGIATLVLSPIVLVLLMVTILGLMLGLFGIFAFAAGLVAAAVLTSVTMGAFISFLIIKRMEVNLLWIGVGTLALHTLLFVPIIGPLIVFVFFLLTLGNLAFSTYRFVR
jgi:cytoskeletal protein CcmA (bactofilin family)